MADEVFHADSVLGLTVTEGFGSDYGSGFGPVLGQLLGQILGQILVEVLGHSVQGTRGLVGWLSLGFETLGRFRPRFWWLVSGWCVN